MLGLRNRATSASHRASLSDLGVAPGATLAPSATAFRAVLHARRRANTALRSGVWGTCSPDKFKNMQYCLGEAILVIDRDHIARSKSMAVHMDTKANRFSVRFSASTADGDTRRGLLGHVDYYVNKGADPTANVVACLSRAMLNFCTGMGSSATRAG